jgi:hypothetical protein
MLASAVCRVCSVAFGRARGALVKHWTAVRRTLVVVLMTGGIAANVLVLSAVFGRSRTVRLSVKPQLPVAGPPRQTSAMVGRPAAQQLSPTGSPFPNLPEISLPVLLPLTAGGAALSAFALKRA